MLEFWLSFDNGAEKLRLPVPPPSFEIRTGNKNTTIDINDIGEINLIGKKKLNEISISTFFPNQQYSFCQYLDFPKPYECVKLIEKWRDSGKPIRFVITNTTINKAMAIESFNYGERDGTGDVYFTLELKEYRFLKVNSTANDTIQSNTQNSRPSQKNIISPYVVKKGDTLIAIAKKVYGDSSKWKDIAMKNNIKDPKKLKIGQNLIV